MNPRPAYSYPDILVYPDGKCQNIKTKEFLIVNYMQGATDGPSVYYRNELNKTRYLSVKTLVAECFVIERKKNKGERVLSIDLNPKNTHYTNLEVDTGKRLRGGSMTSETDCFGWINGSSDIYC
jgi:hypothetical protein